MTDLPTIIADVYRACGWNAWDGANMGLDRFVRDIVPTLNERCWTVSLSQVKGRDGVMFWRAVVPGEVTGSEPRVTVFRATPVEACFRAAWEALIPGENP